MSRLPTTLSSVEPMGRDTILISLSSASSSSPPRCLPRHSAHMLVGSLGLQLKGQPFTTWMGGRMSARALTLLLFPVPFWPLMRSPPIMGFTALRSRASFISSWPTRAENGYTTLVDNAIPMGGGRGKTC